MIIHSYVMSNPDEVPVLPDALDSLTAFSDRVFLVDGGLGGGTLNQHPEHTTPLGKWLLENPYLFAIDKSIPAEFLEGSWNGCRLTLYEHPFENPGDQRNWTLRRMAQEFEQPDWICWIDSDEIYSNEFIRDVRPFLDSLSPDVSNVCPKWLTLIEDEHHYAPAHSNFLTHSRIHHPYIVTWTSQWHEHQYYVGRRVSWDRYVIHSRMLFRRRLFVQRGHAVVNEGAWSNVTAKPIPDGVTWKLHWPEGEPVGMPYSADIREYMNGEYAKWTT